MDRFAARITQPAMNPDERPYFQALGQRIAKARAAADLTQQALADALGISQPQLASYEVGRRRVPVSILPRLARLVRLPIETLIGADDGSGAPAIAVQRRTRRGPVSRLEQQLDAITRLPRAEQKIVSRFLETMIAQHATTTRQEANAA